MRMIPGLRFIMMSTWEIDVLLLLNGTSDLKTKEIIPYAWETT